MKAVLQALQLVAEPVTHVVQLAAVHADEMTWKSVERKEGGKGPKVG